MDTTFQWKGSQNIPDALRRGHDEARAKLVRATTEHGPIAEAARQVAYLCLPHFEREENFVFPVLGLLPDLTRGIVRPEMMEILPLIADFRMRQESLDAKHQRILSAIEDLLQAAHQEKSREYADFAYSLRLHEKVEDEVVYPTVVLIGNYLQEKFAH
jgi:hypothetical protein